MNVPPPPLPAATSFVTLLGRISTVLAVLGVLGALAQMLFAVLLPDTAVAQVVAQPEAPTAVVWVLQHRSALADGLSQ